VASRIVWPEQGSCDVTPRMLNDDDDDGSGGDDDDNCRIATSINKYRCF
jgi:hypothetical protein